MPLLGSSFFWSRGFPAGSNGKRHLLVCVLGEPSWRFLRARSLLGLLPVWSCRGVVQMDHVSGCFFSGDLPVGFWVPFRVRTSTGSSSSTRQIPDWSCLCRVPGFASQRAWRRDAKGIRGQNGGPTNINFDFIDYSTIASQHL